MAIVGTMQRPRRWDSPFSPNMNDAQVARVLSIPPLSAIDAGLFPSTLRLADIIRNDARIERCRRGDIIVRERDYGNSIFLILSGAVGVLPPRRQENRPTRKQRILAERRRAAPQRLNLLSSLAQLWRNARVPEARDVSKYFNLALRYDGDNAPRQVVGDLDALIARVGDIPIIEGGMFGEIAALSRTPRTSTCVALTDCELLELRWQGLRDIRRYDRGFRQWIDSLYRTNSLRSHLIESPLFSDLDATAIDHIIAETYLETYGEFEWFNTFKRQIEESDEVPVIAGEPIIVNQGDYLDGLILIRSGFVRSSVRYASGQHTTVHVGMKNDVFGLEEVFDHWHSGAPLVHWHSLTAIGYVDVLRVPTALVERYVLPNLNDERYHELTRRINFDNASDPTVIDFLVDRRIVNGTAAMMINTARCVGCDDCVRACAAAHDNNPRFVRHGPEHGNLMVANACMHCQDPVCLIGCPTGAIHQLPDGHIIINDLTCIGCGTCANSCPYDNIRLVEIRDRNGAFIVDDATNAPIVKATKCDLCVSQIGGPACQRACPHDALVRMDMRDQAAFIRWMNR